MRFLQLDLRPLPASPSLSAVFPYLGETVESIGGVDVTKYVLTFLVPPANGGLRLILESLGFKSVAVAAPVAGWEVLAWTEAASPLQVWSDQAAPAELQLSKYLSLTVPAGPADAFVTPTALSVATSALPGEAWNPAAHFGFAGLDYRRANGAPQDWKFRLADADNATSPAISFVLPLQITAGLKLGNVTLAIELHPRRADASGEWPGYELSLVHNDAEAVLDNQAEELLFGDHALRLTGGAPTFQMSLRVEGNEPSLSFDLRSWAQLDITCPVLSLHLSQSGEFGVWLESSDNLDGDFGLTLRMSARFNLVMADTTGSPAAIAEIVSLLAKGIDERLAVDFEITLKESVTPRLLLSFQPGERWETAARFWDHVEDIAGQWKKQFDLILGGRDTSLAGLVGDVFGIQYSIRPCRPQLSEQADGDHSFPCRIDRGSLILPVQLYVQAGQNHLEFCLELQFDLATFRLSANRLGFRYTNDESCALRTLVDLQAFAVLLPLRNPQSTAAVDGYFDFLKRELVLTAPVLAASDNPALMTPSPTLVLPGNLDANDLSQRVLFEFKEFRPDSWPKENQDEQPVYLRINGEGISLRAIVRTDHRPNILRSDPNDEHRTAINIAPQAKRDDKVSEIVIINNRIARAVLYGEFDVPGVEELKAKVEIGLTQDQRGKPPRLHAEIDLDKTNGKPIANLSVGFLAAEINDMRARLNWNLANDTWDLAVPVDASFMLAKSIQNTGGLDDLANPGVIKVSNLDLLNLHKGIGGLTLPLPDSVNFTCLDGMFAVSLKKLQMSWERTKKVLTLECDTAEFTFQNPGAFTVTVEIGGVVIDFFYQNFRVKMRNPSRIGIDATIGSSVRFRGEVAWVDNDRERYFAAAGTLAIQGLPEAKALMKIGTGRKKNGQIVPNVVLYGSIDYEVQLFAGVVAKNFGAGIGINNRLTGIDDRPNAERLLARIDEIDPSRIAGWQFVERNGFFLSIVGTTIIASTPGGTSATNAYVASIVLSIDIDLNIVAAAKVWLASSVDFVRKKTNWTRPALVGAVAILPREQLFTAAIESRQNPAIESSDQLSDILNKGKIRISFVLSPNLVDFHLQEISYRANFLGVDMLYQGNMRIAVFDQTLLVRATQKITGHFDKRLEAGPGGFHCSGDVSVGLEFGGLLTRQGLAAYGLLNLQVAFDVEAWITIGFSFTIGCGRWKKTISYEKTFDLGRTRLEIGLSGAVAFDERGQFGFAGTLSISVSICGYGLSISPSLAINEGVISDVRGRVSAFEQRLEEYRAKLLAGGGNNTEALALVAPAPKWQHYQHGTWHLLIPRRDEAWFTPTVVEGDKLAADTTLSPFLESVESIAVTSADGTTVTLKMPWMRSQWGDVSAGVPGPLELIELTMAETAARDGTQLAPRPSYFVLSDPRVESTDRRFWTDYDRATLPEYALPVRMKSAEEILQTVEAPPEFNTVYGRLVNYLVWSQRAAKESRHRGDDQSSEADLEHRRAAALHEMLLALSLSDDEKKQSGWVATAANQNLGLIFELPAGQAPQSAKVSRQTSGGPNVEESVQIESAASLLNDARNHVEILPPRQEFVIDTPSSDDAPEQARVIVRLPIKLNDGDGVSSSFFQNDLPVFSHFEVYRRVRGESKPTLVAGRLLPVIALLERQPNEDAGIAVAAPYVFSDSFEVEGRNVNGSHRRTMVDGRIIPGRTIIEYAIRLVPLGVDESDPLSGLSDWQPVILHLPAKDTFPVDLSLVFQASALYRPQPGTNDPNWAQFHLASLSDEKITLAMHPLPLTAPGAAAAPETRFQIWAEDIVLAASGFYAGDLIAHTDEKSQSPQSAANLSAELEVIPLDDKFEVDFERVVTTSGGPLDQRSGMWRFGEQALKRFARPGYGYQFYIRPRYVGPTGEVAFGPVRRLPINITRVLPQVELTTTQRLAWVESPRVRGIGQLEWIDARVVAETRKLCLENRGKTPLAHIINTTVNIRGLEQEFPPNLVPRVRRRIGISWTHGMHRPSGFEDSLLPAGGVELRVTDRDDSAFESTFTCETLDQHNYRRSLRDFSNDSAWRLTEHEKAFRLGHTKPRPEFLPEADVVTYFTNQTLSLLHDNPALRDFLNASRELKASLTNGTWNQAAGVTSEWIQALRVFEKSPLNLNDPPLRAVIRQSQVLLRYVFLGFSPTPEADFHSLSDARVTEIDEALSRRLLEAEQYRPQANDFQDERAARLAYLDAELGRKIAAVVRRRSAIADDVLATLGADLPLAHTDRTGGNAGWLPRGSAMEECRKACAEHKQRLGSPLEHAQALFDLFPESNKDSHWAKGELQKAIDEIVGLVGFRTGTDPQRKVLAAAVAAKAVALTVGLQKIERHFDSLGYRLYRRPHHRVTVVDGPDGTKKPEPIELKALLPDSVRGITADSTDANNQLVNLEPSPEAGIVCCFNLFERLGFAIDLAASDAVGQPLTPAALVSELRRADLQGLFGKPDAQSALDAHYVFLLTPREPDSEHHGDFPDAQDQNHYAYTGLSFVRLAVIPQKVFNWLLGGPPDPPASPSDPPRPDGHGSAKPQTLNIAMWLRLRGILVSGDNATVSSDAVGQLQQFAAAAHFADPGTMVSGKMEASQPGSVLQVRMTPLQLQTVTVPHVNGFAHVGYTLPDRRGRRLSVSGRSLSRYEPFILWAEGLPRPQLRHVGTPIDVPRILTKSDGPDLPVQLPISVFPHPEKLQFSLTIPPAGVRSILNRISAVRSGYQGYCMKFESCLLDHDDAVKAFAEQKRSWNRVIAGMVLNDTQVVDASPIVVSSPRNAASDVRLFRNQRMITLEHVPYFYGVKLTAHAQFDGNVLTSDVNKVDLKQLQQELQLIAIDPARREPNLIAFRQPQLQPPSGGNDFYQIQIVLTRNGEMCEPQDLRSGIPLRSLDMNLPSEAGPLSPIRISDDFLPELSLGYHFYDLRPESDSSSGDRVYESVIDLLMPWHDGYVDNGDTPANARPWVRTFSANVTIEDADKYPPIRLCPVEGTDVRVAVVSLRFKVDRSKAPQMFLDPTRRVMQVSCRGLLAPVTSVEEVSHG